MVGHHARGARYSMSDLKLCAGIIATTSLHTAAPDMSLGGLQPTMMLRTYNILEFKPRLDH